MLPPPGAIADGIEHAIRVPQMLRCMLWGPLTCKRVPACRRCPGTMRGRPRSWASAARSSRSSRGTAPRCPPPPFLPPPLAQQCVHPPAVPGDRRGSGSITEHLLQAKTRNHPSLATPLQSAGGKRSQALSPPVSGQMGQPQSAPVSWWQAVRGTEPASQWADGSARTAAAPRTWITQEGNVLSIRQPWGPD